VGTWTPTEKEFKVTSRKLRIAWGAGFPKRKKKKKEAGFKVCFFTFALRGKYSIEEALKVGQSFFL
jgi:hypothetical protein